MSRIALVFSLILSIFAMTTTAAYAAPKAPKGVSREFIQALAGVQCSELNEENWAIKGEAGAILELLSYEEGEKFNLVADTWAKKACKVASTNTTKGK